VKITIHTPGGRNTDGLVRQVSVDHVSGQFSVTSVKHGYRVVEHWSNPYGHVLGTVRTVRLAQILIREYLTNLVG